MMKAKGGDGGPTAVSTPNIATFDHKRDAYGFALRPQHVHRYREYASIYKEEEEERLDRWKDFLKRQAESARLPVNGLSTDDKSTLLHAATEESDSNSKSDAAAEKITDEKFGTDDINGNASDNEDIPPVPRPQTHGVQIWTEVRPSLSSIEKIMSSHVKTKLNSAKNQQNILLKKNLSPIEEPRTAKGPPEEDSDEEFYDLEKTESDTIQDVSLTNNVTGITTGVSLVTGSLEPLPLLKEELECLVQGGVPMSLRGELWQAFVGVKERRVENYYQGLLSSDTNSVINVEHENKDSEGNFEAVMDTVHVPEKWKAQIEKDLPRTFPGHPALDDNGRNALRRLLTAYARHNPSVGYCQAMNFFAGLLLLIMPEENAFWTLLGILDDYFDGYFSEEMIESQVDQLVLEELVQGKFPKLFNHLDYLGVQVAWVTGPWFLSIFMNVLPWESVLRVWDVLLFEGNRIMLFRTALALMELYGPALVTTKDAGDAITLLQSLTGSTFDSSQLVLTACMAFQNVKETRLEELRNKHRPAVITTLEERTKGVHVWKDSQGLASKLYGFKHDSGSVLGRYRPTEQVNKESINNISEADSASGNVDEVSTSLAGSEAIESAPGLQEQVVWLKVEFCKLLEEKRSAELRAEELETALMEMVKEDNRRELSARVEQLERDVVELRQALADKREQESAMLQVLMRVEQEQKLTEDARRFAEQDAAAQRFAAQVLQEKYEDATASLAVMERRAIMAESMLEATMQYQSGQNQAQPSPRSMQQGRSPGKSAPDAIQDIPARKISLLSRPFGLGWRDKNKVKSTEESLQKGKPSEESTQLEKLGNLDESSDGKPLNKDQVAISHQKEHGHQVEEEA